jgi:hypothetical protein
MQVETHDDGPTRELGNAHSSVSSGGADGITDATQVACHAITRRARHVEPRGGCHMATICWRPAYPALNKKTL